MARILCINDNPMHVAMFADMFKRREHHEVTTMVPPLDMAAIKALAPEIILLNLVRRLESLRSPIANFYAEVEGARTLKHLLEALPPPRPFLILTGIAVEEAHLPQDLAYAAFVEVPAGLDALLAAIDGLETGVLK